MKIMCTIFVDYTACIPATMNLGPSVVLCGYSFDRSSQWRKRSLQSLGFFVKGWKIVHAGADNKCIALYKLVVTSLQKSSTQGPSQVWVYLVLDLCYYWCMHTHLHCMLCAWHGALRAHVEFTQHCYNIIPQAGYVPLEYWQPTCKVVYSCLHWPRKIHY